jgi:hypothetical protein
MYVLSEEGERDDDVGPYGKSLLYLVSNAFEGRQETPILGMRRFIDADATLSDLFTGKVDGKWPALVVAGADGDEFSQSHSSSHGGFDNDESTLNSILRRILDDPEPAKLFKLHDLQFGKPLRPSRDGFRGKIGAAARRRQEEPAFIG